MQNNWKRTFSLIYTGQAFSIIGSAAVQFAVIWWLTETTESALTLTTASIVSFIPFLLVGPFAGVLIDRLSRKTIMIAADGFVALTSVALGAAFLLYDAPPLWFLYAVLFARGVGAAFHSPAMQATIPTLVPADMLTKAGGWGNLVTSAGQMLGPVIGAALMSFLPVATIMLVDIGGAAFAILCLFFVRIPRVAAEHAQEQTHFGRDMRQGFHAITRNKPLMALFFPMMLCSVIFQPLGALYPLLVRTHYNGLAWHNGVTEFVFAGGLLLSSLVMGVWGTKKRRFLMVSLAIVLLGAASCVSGMLPPSGFIAFLICTFAMGISGTFINVPIMAYTQETTPPETLGKVMSLLMAATMLAMPVGLLIAGPLSQWVGVDNWFFYSGIAVAAVGALCWVMTHRYDALPE